MKWLAAATAEAQAEDKKDINTPKHLRSSSSSYRIPTATDGNNESTGTDETPPTVEHDHRTALAASSVVSDVSLESTGDIIRQKISMDSPVKVSTHHGDASLRKKWPAWLRARGGAMSEPGIEKQQTRHRSRTGHGLLLSPAVTDRLICEHLAGNEGSPPSGTLPQEQQLHYDDVSKDAAGKLGTIHGEGNRVDNGS